MTRWAVVVEQNIGNTHARHWEAAVVEELTGSREEALAALWEQVESFRPRHPMNVRRKMVFRDGDGYLVVNRGVTRDYPCRFHVYELVWDSAAK